MIEQSHGEQWPFPKCFWSSPTTSELVPGTANAFKCCYEHGYLPLSLQNDCATVLTVASSLDPKEQSITPRITLQVRYLELRSSVGYNSPEVGESS